MEYKHKTENFMIPPFSKDGYLPVGVHLADISEITFSFGSSTSKRRRLILRVRRWVELCRAVGAKRLLLDGSFVTAKSMPGDVDAVVLLPENFEQLLISGNVAAMELDEMLMTRQPEEIFAAEDQNDWDEWVMFFSRTRESDGRSKGLLEVIL